MTPGPLAESKKLLRIWGRDRDAELSFSDLISRAESALHLEKRTVINYTNNLIEMEILEKRVDLHRKTYYKLKKKEEFDKEILKERVDELSDPDAAFLLSSLTLGFLGEITKKTRSKKSSAITVNQASAALAKAKTDALEAYRRYGDFKKQLEDLKKTSP